MSIPDIAPQTVVDNAARALIDLLHAMARLERAKPEPAKWDEEYAGYAVNDCIDRLFCAPEARMPKPSEHLSARYHDAYDLARPFLEEGYPLPGSVEEDAFERARKMYAERWPGPGTFDDLPFGDAVRVAIWLEAHRDAEAARA